MAANCIVLLGQASDHSVGGRTVHEFIIFTIGGLAAAGIYAITAAGLTLTYTTTGIFNWAHGAIGMICAFAYWQMSIGWGWPVLVSMFVCIFVLAPVIGIVIEAAVMRRLEGVSEAAKLVVTLSIALMFLGIAQWIWSPTTYRALPPLFNNDTLVVGSIRISYNDVTILILALAVAIGLRLFLYRTRIGVTMRASVDDRTLTSLNGSSAVTNARNAWIIGSMLAALAGILIAPTLTLSAPALTLLIVNAYAASVIGRLRSIPMTFLGAIILGLSIAYSVAYLPQNPYVQGFENAVPAIILFIALLVLPATSLRGHRQLRSRELAFRPTLERHRPALRRDDRRRHFLRHHRRQGRHVQPQQDVGSGHRRALRHPHRRLRRAPVVVPDDLRRHRRHHGGAPGGHGESPLPPGRGRGMRGHRRRSSPSPPCGSRASTSPWPRRPSPPPWTTGCSSSPPSTSSGTPTRHSAQGRSPSLPSTSVRWRSSPRRRSSSRGRSPSRSWSFWSSPCGDPSSGSGSWP